MPNFFCRFSETVKEIDYLRKAGLNRQDTKSPSYTKTLVLPLRLGTLGFLMLCVYQARKY
jgi:hypothetical protein